MYYVLGLFSLMRPLNMLLGSASVAALMYFIAPLSFSWSVAGIPALIVALSVGAGNVINDISDIKVDQVNHPERFLARHPEHKSSAWIVFAILVALIVFMMIITGKILSFPLMALGLAVGSLLVLYSLVLKGYLFWGNLTVAFCASMVVPFSYFWLKYEYILPGQRPAPALILYGALIFLIHFSREVSKSMVDHVGDLLRQSVTYVSAGYTHSLRIVLNWSTLAMGLALMLLVLIMRSAVSWYIIPIFTLLLVALYKILRLIPNISSIREAQRLSRYQKWTMALGIASLLCWKY
jgi:4-hydroxybenzoate polyprenyltransferase